MFLLVPLYLGHCKILKLPAHWETAYLPITSNSSPEMTARISGGVIGLKILDSKQVYTK